MVHTLCTCMLVKLGYRHTLRVCNTSCFIRQSWLHKRSSVLHLYLHCLPCHELNYGIQLKSANINCSSVRSLLHFRSSSQTVSLLLACLFVLSVVDYASDQFVSLAVGRTLSGYSPFSPYAEWLLSFHCPTLILSATAVGDGLAHN